MKYIKLLFLLLLLVAPIFAGAPKNGEELIAQMQKKYAGKWYKTLTFVQKTTNFKPDGTSEVQIWHEAMSVPGKLRIDFTPLEKGDGILFVDGMMHSFRDTKLTRSQPLIHSLLVLGFDVYGQPVEKTVSQLKELKLDLSVIHEDTWQGKPVYVVGAKKGDLQTPQFWIDKKNLYFVRLIQLGGKDGKSVRETQFNKYQKVKGGGWVSAEVIFMVDGKTTTTEDYTDIQVDVPLDSKLFENASWMTADRNYYQVKGKK
ncbi:MAG: outer membrane lipoprotein-sorting protein [Pyrinomonadaceae bacterium]|nr:outer membrane lipoprotein-sorting protein [Pyrinomonadaceae bacterium]